MIQAEAQAAKNFGPLDPPASIPLRKIPASVLLCFCLRVESRADAKPGAPAGGQPLPVVAGMAPAPSLRQAMDACVRVCRSAGFPVLAEEQSSDALPRQVWGWCPEDPHRTSPAARACVRRAPSSEQCVHQSFRHDPWSGAWLCESFLGCRAQHVFSVVFDTTSGRMIKLLPAHPLEGCRSDVTPAIPFKPG